MMKERKKNFRFDPNLASHSFVCVPLFFFPQRDHDIIYIYVCGLVRMRRRGGGLAVDWAIMYPYISSFLVVDFEALASIKYT
jgi:hypothetical protein